MSNPPSGPAPSTFGEDLRQAVRLFIEEAYGDAPPSFAARCLPPEGDFDPAAWLMGDVAERVPPEAPFEEVEAFSLRIGCPHYRHMKLRLARPGPGQPFVFLADCHDSFLQAPPGSRDHQGIEELKRRNAAVARKITGAWDRAGVRTERSYLREKIHEARQRR